MRILHNLFKFPESFLTNIYVLISQSPCVDLKEAENANEGHLEAIDKLEQTLFELQGEMGGGRHIPPGTRVLCLRENPASQWQDLSKRAMDRLKEENEALLKRLKQLEDGGVRVAGDDGPQEDLIPRESLEVVSREKEELEEALKQKEKRLVRLRQVCALCQFGCLKSIDPIRHVGLVRFSLQKPTNSKKLLPLYWESNSHSTLTAKCESPPNSI